MYKNKEKLEKASEVWPYCIQSVGPIFGQMLIMNVSLHCKKEQKEHISLKWCITIWPKIRVQFWMDPELDGWIFSIFQNLNCWREDKF